MTRQPVPISVVTGFLGSGKTTLLNHILDHAGGRKIGLVVNDFGAISIDDKLIDRRTETVIELANGCVCCSLDVDLLRSLANLMQTGPALDQILIETSGVADPFPVAVALARFEEEGAARVDAIVTVVDAANFDENLDRAEVAYHQLVYGDILLINKVDLVGPEVPKLIEEGIRTINPKARLIPCARGEVDIALLLGPAAEPASPKVRDTDVERQAHHDSTFDQMAFVDATPLDRARFASFVDAIPREVFRAKGFLRFAGDPARYVFHLVGERSTVVPDGSWSSGEIGQTSLVFIGRGFDAGALERDLHGCLAGSEEVRAVDRRRSGV